MKIRPVTAPNPTKARVFLTAEWRHLVILNYVVDSTVLQPFVPAGTELDFWQAQAYVSVVGFRFLRTRVCGLAIPFHQNFEEVNLRFYVRRSGDAGWRRGVVFIRELVPRRAIALIARAVYNENYWAVPMTHRIDPAPGRRSPIRSVEYGWRHQRAEHRLTATVRGEPHEMAAGSEAEFITEHYWGYTAQRDGSTMEYQVEHPRWRVWPEVQADLSDSVPGFYGESFAPYLRKRPASAFVAEGSAVSVHHGVRI